MEKEEYIRVGTTLYKLVDQPKLGGALYASVSYGTTKRCAKTMARTLWQVYLSTMASVPCQTM